MTRKLFQLRYSGRGPVPNARQLSAIREHYLATGLTPRNIEIRAICWNATTKNTRKAIGKIARPWTGNPGLIARTHETGWTYCDFDAHTAPQLFRFWVFARVLNLHPYLIEYRRTRRGWHVAIAWDQTLSDIETVCAQSILGSDHGREMFNLARVRGGLTADNKNWNILFERKIK